MVAHIQIYDHPLHSSPKHTLAHSTKKPHKSTQKAHFLHTRKKGIARFVPILLAFHSLFFPSKVQHSGEGDTPPFSARRERRHFASAAQNEGENYHTLLNHGITRELLLLSPDGRNLSLWSFEKTRVPDCLAPVAADALFLYQPHTGNSHSRSFHGVFRGEEFAYPPAPSTSIHFEERKKRQRKRAQRNV